VASDPELPEVDVDLRRLDQIFTNLIENSAHALRGVARGADRAARGGGARHRATGAPRRRSERRAVRRAAGRPTRWRSA